MVYLLYSIVGVICIYTARHYWFTLNRLFGFQRHPYIDIDTADWPQVTVLVAAHNEEKVIANILSALMTVNYPQDKMLVMPVNDRSKDRTRQIIDKFVKDFPGRIRPFHRTSGKPGKAAALKDAMELIATEVTLIFDADYIPGAGLIKQLVAPFFDPEVGGVMGRVVPLNCGTNLLTRLLDLERSGGYQVDQQARMNLRLVPQHGGTVAGVRLSALREIGGWDDTTLTEDTDLTYRLLLQLFGHERGSFTGADRRRIAFGRLHHGSGHDSRLGFCFDPVLPGSGAVQRHRRASEYQDLCSGR